MDFLNWKNIAALLVGGIIAGIILGAFKAYEHHKEEEIAKKLFLVEDYLSKNETQKAEKLLKEIPPPAVGYAALRLGDYYASANRTEKALSLFVEAAEALHDVDKPLYYFTLEREGYLLYLKGEYEKSLQLLEKLPEDIPNFCEVSLIKAQDYIALGKGQRAYDELNRVLNGCPDKESQLTAKYLLYTRLKGEKTNVGETSLKKE